MSQNNILVTIDGPVASGKGAVGKILCSKLNLKRLDSGAIYRTVSYVLDREGIGVENFKVDDLSRIGKIEFDSNGFVLLDGVNIENEIRTPGIGKLSAPFSSINEIREFCNQIQRNITIDGGYLLDGRDAGTVVLPHADLKIYLDAALEERVRRRQKDFLDKGIETSFEEVKKQIEERDYIDKNKGEASLRVPEGALYIDNTNLSIDKQVELIMKRYDEIISSK